MSSAVIEWALDQTAADQQKLLLATVVILHIETLVRLFERHADFAARPFRAARHPGHASPAACYLVLAGVLAQDSKTIAAVRRLLFPPLPDPPPSVRQRPPRSLAEI